MDSGYHAENLIAAPVNFSFRRVWGCMSETGLSYEDALTWMHSGLSAHLMDQAVVCAFIRARDPVNAIRFSLLSRASVLVGYWQDFAEAVGVDPCHSDLLGGSWQSHLGAAAALEAFVYDRPLPPLHPKLARWLLSPRLEDPAWWCGLLDELFRSPLLSGLVQHAFAARVRQTWITQAHPIPWMSFELPWRQPHETIADMVCSDRQGWVEPIPESSETTALAVPVYAQEHSEYEIQVSIQCERARAIVFRNGIIFGVNGTFFYRGTRPVAIGTSFLGQKYGARFLSSTFFATLNHQDEIISQTELPILYLSDDFHFNYYHVLIDYVGRLARLEYLVEQEQFFIGVAEDDQALMVPILEAIGFRDYVLPLPPTPVAFPWVAVAATPQKGPRAAPDTLQWLANRLHRFFPPSAKHRVLVSRQDAGERRILNEDAIMAVLQPLGFQLVVLSKMSIAKQFSLFANAEVVVAPHGAGLSNIVASQSGTAVVEISPDLGLDCFFWISHVLGHRHVAVMAEWQERDLLVDPTRVLQALADLGIS
ncbi:MAG: glycosyltransferase family 61 protein [Alphaproteobacteria bacterium]|nr:glycosyltransferase family 61 protein [Alphaproteobacteria bacterium]